MSIEAHRFDRKQRLTLAKLAEDVDPALTPGDPGVAALLAHPCATQAEALGFSVDLTVLSEGYEHDDAANAEAIYAALPPSVIGRISHDLGFWAWLSLSDPYARHYIKIRWPRRSIQLSIFGERSRNALYVLWLGAHLMRQSLDESGEVHGEYSKALKMLFHNQTLFQNVREVQWLRHPSVLYRYVSFVHENQLKEDQIATLNVAVRCRSGVCRFAVLTREALFAEFSRARTIV